MSPSLGTRRRPRVVYWTPIPSPYMVERFNAWADCGDVELRVWFNAREVANRKWRIHEPSWRFRYRYLRARYWRGWWYGVPWPLLFGSRPDLLVLIHSEPIYIFGMLLAKLRRVPTVFVMHGPPDGYSPEHPAKEWLKHRMFEAVDEVWCAGPQTQAFWQRYSKRGEKMHTLAHCTDVAHFRQGAAAARGSRTTRRKAWGVQGTTFVFVGGLWPRKGVDVLLDAYETLSAEVAAPLSLLIVGEGHLRAQLEADAQQRGLANVVFAGYVQRDDLPGVLALADVFVFPTRADVYGHVVEEAMACGLPVISTDEIGEATFRVREGETGHLVPVDDAAKLATAMARFTGAAGLERAAAMGARAAASPSVRGPEDWAADATALTRAAIARHSQAESERAA